MNVQKTNKRHKRLMNVFDALGDPTRFQIVQLLMKGEDFCVTDLAVEVGISIPGVSQQLKHLELKDIVYRERFGQKTCYKLCKDDAIVKDMLECIKKVKE